MHHDRARKYGRIAAGIVVTWVLIVGALTGIGKLIMITHNGNGNLLVITRSRTGSPRTVRRR